MKLLILIEFFTKLFEFIKVLNENYELILSWVNLPVNMLLF